MAKESDNTPKYETMVERATENRREFQEDSGKITTPRPKPSPLMTSKPSEKK